MRITSVNVTNFLGIAHLAIKTDARAVLICGPNGSGKSTVQDAIRFALTGAPPRGIRTKANYRDMVRDGSADGSVALGVDGKGFTRSARTGELIAGGLAKMPDALPYVLDAQRFASLGLTERRQFLFGLSGVQVDHDSIAAELVERGCGKEYVDQIKTILRAGFDGAAKLADQRATESRGAWKQITGETYGAVKAETWAPKTTTTEAPDAKAITAAEASVNELRAKLNAINQDIGAAQHQAAAAARMTPPDKVAEWRERKAVGERELVKARAELQTVMASDPGSANGFIGPCPCCGERIAFTGQEFVRAPEKTIAPKQFVERRAAAEKRITEVEAGITKLAASIAQAEAEAALNSEPAANIEALRTQRANADAELARASNDLDAMRLASGAAAKAEQDREQAAKRHHDVKQWVQLAELLSPDGLPAERLAKALAPFNDRMRRTAELTGWPQVAIANDIEITIGGRFYALCSESERWRADLAVADAIATVSGLRLLLLDRMDVLDAQANRGTFLFDWLDAVRDDYDTIIVSATLKQPPEIEGVHVVWMGDNTTAAKAA